MKLSRTFTFSAIAALAALCSLAGSALAAWPTTPVHGFHVIRGAFMDARGTNYHHGIDIPVDDDHPDAGAPGKWASHRVYAVKSGTIGYMMHSPVTPTSSCTANRFAVSQEIFYHVVPIVSLGQHVRAGQQIGWSCRGRWHVHLTEGFGIATKNPLRPGHQVVGPYRNPLKPTINEISTWTACDSHYVDNAIRTLVPPCGRRISSGTLHGLVDVRFEAEENQPMFDFFALHPSFYSPSEPYAAHLRVERVTATGKPAGTVTDRQIFTADGLAGQAPLPVHWAPGFGRWLPFVNCARLIAQNARHGHRDAQIRPKPAPKPAAPAPPAAVTPVPFAPGSFVPINRDDAGCSGAFWFRAFAERTNAGWTRYWDTTRVPDGHYRIAISVTSLTGQRSTRRLNVTVANHTSGAAHSSTRKLDRPVPDYAAAPDEFTNESAGEIAAFRAVARAEHANAS
jgi:hypothetical protein